MDFELDNIELYSNLFEFDFKVDFRRTENKFFALFFFLKINLIKIFVFKIYQNF